MSTRPSRSAGTIPVAFAAGPPIMVATVASALLVMPIGMGEDAAIGLRLAIGGPVQARHPAANTVTAPVWASTSRIIAEP